MIKQSIKQEIENMLTAKIQQIKRINNLFVFNYKEISLSQLEQIVSLNETHIDTNMEDQKFFKIECFSPSENTVASFIFKNTTGLKKKNKGIGFELIDIYGDVNLAYTDDSDKVMLIEIPIEIIDISEGQDLSHFQREFSEIYSNGGDLPENVRIRSLDSVLTELNEYDPMYYYKPVII